MRLDKIIGLRAWEEGGCSTSRGGEKGRRSFSLNLKSVGSQRSPAEALAGRACDSFCSPTGPLGLEITAVKGLVQGTRVPPTR